MEYWIRKTRVQNWQILPSLVTTEPKERRKKAEISTAPSLSLYHIPSLRSWFGSSSRQAPQMLWKCISISSYFKHLRFYWWSCYCVNKIVSLCLDEERPHSPTSYLLGLKNDNFSHWITNWSTEYQFCKPKCAWEVGRYSVFFLQCPIFFHSTLRHSPSKRSNDNFWIPYSEFLVICLIFCYYVETTSITKKKNVNCLIITNIICKSNCLSLFCPPPCFKKQTTSTPPIHTHTHHHTHLIFFPESLTNK